MLDPMERDQAPAEKRPKYGRRREGGGDAQRRRESCLPDAAAKKPAGSVDVLSPGEEAPREDRR